MLPLEKMSHLALSTIICGLIKVANSHKPVGEKNVIYPSYICPPPPPQCN